MGKQIQSFRNPVPVVDRIKRDQVINHIQKSHTGKQLEYPGGLNGNMGLPVIEPEHI